MIKAINKQGTVSQFTEKVWNMMGKNKNGFLEITDEHLPVHIPDKIIEFQAKKISPPPEAKMEITSNKTPDDAKAGIDIMKEYLTSKGIKFHHMAGYDKIKKLYDDSKE